MTPERGQPVGFSCGCATKILNFLSTNSSVHPLEPMAPNHSEFVYVGSKLKLRVIHIKPNDSVQSTCINNVKKRYSASEEYWFTRWNRPLRTGNCNCSFRRSLRFSAVENNGLLHTSGNAQINYNHLNEDRFSNYDLPPTRIVNIETFVERIIQETLFEAFQEYYMQKTTNNVHNIGINNKAFAVTEEKCLRKTSDPPVLEVECITAQPLFAHQSSEVQKSSVRKICDHQLQTASKTKPLVMLLHGIGCSADIWWTIIQSIQLRGLEIIAPDMLGHGFSSAPDKASFYTFQNLLKMSLAILDHYSSGGTKKIVLIGHSFGCSLATAMYKVRAQQISQMVLISGGGPTPLAPPPTDSETTIFGYLQSFIMPLLMCGLKRSLFFASRGKHIAACDVDTAVPKHIFDYIAKGQSWSEGDAAFHRRILIPTLLVHGLQDKKITLVQECEMERTIPRAFLELIPNAGHLSMLETPEHLSHMILCFLEWWSR